MSDPRFPGFAAGDEIKLAAQVAIDQNFNQYAIAWVQNLFGRQWVSHRSRGQGVFARL
ncbi:MAG: hypothetical protein ABSB86_14830 [Bryobacteraceae bacterium]